MKIVSAARLTGLVSAIMQAAGCSVEESRTVARRLVDSNLVGHDSHGVIRVGKYLEWMHAGWLKPNQPPTMVFDSLSRVAKAITVPAALSCSASSM